jgi:ribosomal protein S18 acetylase RimI-like enzyme
MNDQSTLKQNSGGLALLSDWMADVQIRHAKQADLPAMEWEGEYSRFRRKYFQVYQRTQRGSAIIWVADLLHVGVIGQVLVQLTAIKKPELAKGIKRAYVHSFRVYPAFRRAGLGMRLMKTLEVDLVERGYKEITLNVTQTNTGALRLYRTLGYKVIGEDPGCWSYYDENNVLQEVEEPGWRLLKVLE